VVVCYLSVELLQITEHCVVNKECHALGIEFVNNTHKIKGLYSFITRCNLFNHLKYPLTPLAGGLDRR